MKNFGRILQYYSKDPVSFFILAIFFGWLFLSIGRSTTGDDDYNIFAYAAERIGTRENIYGPPFYGELKYFYSPLFALILSWFHAIPIYIQKALWFLMNFILFLRSVCILRQYISWNFKGRNLALVALCLLSAKLLLHNFTSNQLTVFLLWTLLESFHRMEKKQYAAGIILFSLGMNFKIISILLVPYFLWLRREKLNRWVLICSVFFLLLPGVFLGWNYAQLLTKEWFSLINPMDPVHVLQNTEPGFLDLGTLVCRYLSDSRILNEHSINFASLDTRWIFWISMLCRILLLGAVIFVTRKIRTNLAGMQRRFLQMLPFVALIPLIMPHQRDYSFLFVLPMYYALFVMVKKLNQHVLNIALLLITVLSGLPVWSTLIGSENVEFFYHYKLVTVGMTGLLLLFLYVVRIFIQKNSNIVTCSAKEVIRRVSRPVYAEL